MARSVRKTPVRGNTTNDSEKADKVFANRILRRTTKIALESGKEILPVLREVSDPWRMAKDGKTRFDPVKWPKLLRK
jgi:hypothetical protein